MTANQSSSKMSPLKLVAFSQKPKWKPRKITAATGGIQANEPVR